MKSFNVLGVFSLVLLCACAPKDSSKNQNSYARENPHSSQSIEVSDSNDGPQNREGNILRCKAEVEAGEKNDFQLVAYIKDNKHLTTLNVSDSTTSGIHVLFFAAESVEGEVKGLSGEDRDTT